MRVSDILLLCVMLKELEGVPAPNPSDALNFNIFFKVHQQQPENKLLNFGEILYEKYRASIDDVQFIRTDDLCAGVICTTERISVDLECCDLKKHRKNVKI